MADPGTGRPGSRYLAPQFLNIFKNFVINLTVLIRYDAQSTHPLTHKERIDLRIKMILYAHCEYCKIYEQMNASRFQLHAKAWTGTLKTTPKITEKRNYEYKNLKETFLRDIAYPSQTSVRWRRKIPSHTSCQSAPSYQSIRVDKNKPASVELSIQCQLLIPTALTSIQNPLPYSKLSEALRNSASLD